MRILVVDDDRDNAELLGAILDADGNEVELAYSGVDALSAFEQHEPDVVMLDLDMPGITGVDVGRQMRQRGRKTLTIMAITGWGRGEDREATRVAGFNMHFVKPIEQEALLTAVELCRMRRVLRGAA